MERRDFIRKTGLAAGASVILPYILPSGRLFAQQEAQKAGHVVLVIFGGGVRQQESVLQRYLDDSQGYPVQGNIMLNMFDGAPPEEKVVYGPGIGSDGLPGSTPMDPVLSSTLQSQGTLFKEVRSTSPGHYSGLVSMLQGNTVVSQGLRQKPLLPTIFEYVRKHAGFSATETWMVGHTIRNSVPLLNYSNHPEYGAKYGANFYAPSTTFGSEGVTAYANAKVYHPQEELSHIYGLQGFLDDYYTNVGGALLNLNNTADEKIAIKTFMEEIYASGSRPTSVMACAGQVMETFKPKLTVVDFSAGVDGCHGNFTGYLQAIHKADNQVAQLWNKIQSIPEMAGNTVMMCTPECGRNLNPNPIKDQNDWYGYDHSDANTSRIFNMMVGKGVRAGEVIGNEDNPVGLSADIVPTIAEIFGIKQTVYNQGFLNGSARSLFDHM
ncbi:MAG: hypothetical protein ACJAUV_000666 [Flavobacteriales bacterium]|jgi:hypothetical protein